MLHSWLVSQVLLYIWQVLSLNDIWSYGHWRRYFLWNPPKVQFSASSVGWFSLSPHYRNHSIIHIVRLHFQQTVQSPLNMFNWLTSGKTWSLIAHIYIDIHSEILRSCRKPLGPGLTYLISLKVRLINLMHCWIVIRNGVIQYHDTLLRYWSMTIHYFIVLYICLNNIVVSDTFNCLLFTLFHFEARGLLYKNFHF